jgi:hypothetical protein
VPLSTAMSNYGDQAQPALLNAFLLSTKDALMVFEAARRGICPVVTRRLHDSEKTSLVVSGSVFAFDEHATGIKRCALRPSGRACDLVPRLTRSHGPQGRMEPSGVLPASLATTSSTEVSYDCACHTALAKS